MISESDYTRYIESLHTEGLDFKIVCKNTSRVQRAIGKFLSIITFGGMTEYMSRYTTTIGRTIYVSPDWDNRSVQDRYMTIRHEAAHLRQFKCWTLPLMAIAYLLLPLPFGLAWFRMKIEKAGYRETIRAAAEVYGIKVIRSSRFKKFIVSQFTGPSYAWMWPFKKSMERWYDSVVVECEKEVG